MVTWGMLSFQDSAAPLMEQLVFFHDHAMMILLMITSLVVYMIVMLSCESVLSRFLLEGQEIEIVWTIFPAFVLVFIAFPSLRLLYLLDEVSSPVISLSIIGHQWYWSYEYSDFFKMEFDSYMDIGLSDGFRLLDVDNRIVLPLSGVVRVLVGSDDVIHSWTVPVLGVKLDAVPGRLNQGVFCLNRVGLFYGQCSEICGANHSFMPIVIEAVIPSGFIGWVES